MKLFRELLYFIIAFFKQRALWFIIIFIIFWLIIYIKNWLTLSAFINLWIVFLILIVWVFVLYLNKAIYEFCRDKSANWEVDWDNVLDRADDFNKEFCNVIHGIRYKKNRWIIFFFIIIALFYCISR